MTPQERKVIELALEALETERENYQDWDKEDGAPEYIYEAITAMKELLAQPEQEPCEYCKRGLKTMCLCGIKAKPKEPEHDLYTDADKDKPDAICDGNGQVALAMCKKCGKAEIELDEPCVKPQPEQEPVDYCGIHYLPEPCAQCAKEHESYTTPPQRKPLTDEQITVIAREHWGYAGMNNAELAFARAIEAAHGIKGEA